MVFAGYGEKVGIADGNGQGGVFGQIQVLAGEGRDDDAQSLGEDDESQGLRRCKPQRGGGLPLALGNGLDPSAHNFGDEGGSINDKSGEQSHELLAEHLPGPLC